STWAPLGSGVLGTDQFSVSALVFMPNGDLIAGGSFVHAGSVSANYIARWNGSAWSALGSGMDFNVYALAVLPNGDLVTGGGFTHAGGVFARGVARWDGSGWTPMGSGLGILVDAMVV